MNRRSALRGDGSAGLVDTWSAALEDKSSEELLSMRVALNAKLNAVVLEER